MMHRRLATAAAVLALAAAGCGTGSSTDTSGGGDTGDGNAMAGPGVDAAKKTIHVGQITALSGPVAALGRPLLDGTRTYFEALNANGGIDGWKVQLDVKDSAYRPQEHVQAFNELKPDIALLQSTGSPTTKAIQPLIDSERIVTQPFATFDSLWGLDRFLAPVGTPFAFDMANALDYATDAGRRTPKVGVIYQNDEYGADGLRGFEAAVEGYGLDEVARETYAVGDTDFTAQVQKLKSAGAEVVAVIAVPGASGPIVGAAAALGYKPQWIFQGPAFLEQLITDDGTARGKPTPLAEALAGTLVTSFAAPWGDPDAPAMAQLIEDQKRFAPDQTPSVYFTFGYASAKAVEAILRTAIAEGDLSRAGVLDAKLSTGRVDLGGLTPDVEYTPELGPPSRATLITRIDPRVDGFLAPVAEAYEGRVARDLEIER